MLPPHSPVTELVKHLCPRCSELPVDRFAHVSDPFKGPTTEVPGRGVKRGKCVRSELLTSEASGIPLRLRHEEEEAFLAELHSSSLTFPLKGKLARYRIEPGRFIRLPDTATTLAAFDFLYANG